MENETTLEQLLAVNNIIKIDSIEDINNVYDTEELLQTGNVTIVDGRKRIIIFDTPVFNSCYIVDVFNKFLETEKIENTIFNYCDNLEIYTFLFKDFFKEKFSTEKPLPVILIFDGDDIFTVTENFGPITEKDIAEVKQIVDAN